MSGDTSEATDRARRLEMRAHTLRMAILDDREFMAGVLEGAAQMDRGEGRTLADFDRDFAEDLEPDPE